MLFVLALAGCGASTHGPAWPTSSATRGDDGGESLAPRPSAHELAASSESNEVVAAPAPAAPVEKPAEPAPTVTPTVAPPTEEPATTEEITIEVDDD